MIRTPLSRQLLKLALTLASGERHPLAAPRRWREGDVGMQLDQLVGQVAHVPSAAGAGEVSIKALAAAGAKPANAAVQPG